MLSDLVVIDDGVQTVSDRQDGAVGESRSDGLLDDLVCIENNQIGNLVGQRE